MIDNKEEFIDQVKIVEKNNKFVDSNTNLNVDKEQITRMLKFNKPTELLKFQQFFKSIFPSRCIRHQQVWFPWEDFHLVEQASCHKWILAILALCSLTLQVSGNVLHTSCMKAMNCPGSGVI